LAHCHTDYPNLHSFLHHFPPLAFTHSYMQ
jgi:hypothetical protein